LLFFQVDTWWRRDVRYQPLVGDQLTGHLGGIVASRNTYGLYLKQRRSPVNRKTAPQQDQRLAFQIISAAWRSIGPTVQAAWVAARWVKKSRRGFVVTLTGQALYMFVNVLRQRLGLSLMDFPPSSADPTTFTLPSGSISAPGDVTLTFDGLDEWNQVGGGVIISCTQPLQPGVSYLQSFLALGQAVGATAIPETFTLPYALPGAGGVTVRLRYHCTGPDGRQTEVMDQDFLVEAVGTRVAEVQVVTALTALWVFTNDVTADGTASAALKVDSTSPSATAQAGPNSALCTYGSGHVGVGKTWEIASLPTHVVAVPAIMFPESGLVT
jgi:hypothetical protein